MGSLAGYPFIRLAGMPPKLPGIVLEEITRSGIPGKAFWQKGLSAQPFQVQAVGLYANLSALNLAQYTYAALQGAFIVAVDDLGQYWYDLMVHSVEPCPVDGEVNQRIITTSTTPSATYMLGTCWTLESIYVP